MSGRRNALLAGPLLVFAAVLGGLASTDAAARARLLDEPAEDAVAADTRPAETRRAAREVSPAEVDERDLGPEERLRMRRERVAGLERDRDRDVEITLDRDRGRDDVGDRREGRRDSSSSRDREWFRDPGYYGYGNFPTVEVHDAVVANARAATARAIFRRAENALNGAVRKAVRTFETSGELRDARRAEKEAYAAYATARRRALQSVLEDPKYRSIMSLRQELTDQITYRRTSRDMNERTDRQVRDDILALATLKMNYAADARAMEQLALETNAQAREAQEKFRVASSRVSELKRDFDDALHNDRDLLAARRNLEDARIARLTTSAYLKGAASAAEEALDFAYYLNRYSRYSGAGYQDYRDYYPYNYPSRYAGY